MLRRRLAGRLGAEWKDYLDDAVKNYNNNKHSIIKMAPNDVNPANYAAVKAEKSSKAKKTTQPKKNQLKKKAKSTKGK